MDTYRNFIGGKWIESSSSKTVSNVNPANTDDIIGTVRQATRAETRAAVDAASEAFHSWRKTPAPARGKIVAQAARLMEAAKEELAQILTREDHDPIRRDHPLHEVGKLRAVRPGGGFLVELGDVDQ